MKILIRRLLMSRLIWILTVCKHMSEFTRCQKLLDFTLPTDPKSSEYYCRQTHCTAMKRHPTITRHQETNYYYSKATGSIFPIKMIAKLEWTQSNAQQNIEQLQTPTIRVHVTINNESRTEPPP